MSRKLRCSVSIGFATSLDSIPDMILSDGGSGTPIVQKSLSESSPRIYQEVYQFRITRIFRYRYILPYLPSLLLLFNEPFQSNGTFNLAAAIVDIGKYLGSERSDIGLTFF